MDYDAAIEYLYSFARLMRGKADTHTALSFNRFSALMALLGEPQNRFRSIHVAGTKGKGSTSRLIQSILMAAGYRVGLYTSPHIHSYRERIRIGDRLIGEAELAAIVRRFPTLFASLQQQYPDLGTPGLFEWGTALAFLYFAAEQPDWVVVETGIGGAFDPTNVVTPATAVLTSISLDHMDVLGTTLSQIAAAKSGIIKPNTPAVSSQQVDVVRLVLDAVADIREAPLTHVGEELWIVAGSERLLRLPGQRAAASQQFSLAFAADFPIAGANLPPLAVSLPLLGAYQRDNAPTAVAATLLAVPQLSLSAVQVGLAGAHWPGRLEVLADQQGSPLLVVDGAHNPDAALRLRDDLGNRDLFAYERLILILGTSATHAPAEIVTILAPLAAVLIVTRSRHLRASDPASLATAAALANPTAVLRITESVTDALRLAQELAGPRDLICCTGSIFVMAEARAQVGHAAEVDRVQF